MNIERESSLNIAKKPIFQYNYNESNKNTVLLLKDKTVSIQSDAKQTHKLNFSQNLQTRPQTTKNSLSQTQNVTSMLKSTHARRKFQQDFVNKLYTNSQVPYNDLIRMSSEIQNQQMLYDIFDKQFSYNRKIRKSQSKDVPQFKPSQKPKKKQLKKNFIIESSMSSQNKILSSSYLKRKQEEHENQLIQDLLQTNDIRRPIYSKGDLVTISSQDNELSIIKQSEGAGQKSYEQMNIINNAQLSENESQNFMRQNFSGNIYISDQPSQQTFVERFKLRKHINKGSFENFNQFSNQSSFNGNLLLSRNMKSQTGMRNSKNRIYYKDDVRQSAELIASQNKSFNNSNKKQKFTRNKDKESQIKAQKLKQKMELKEKYQIISQYKHNSGANTSQLGMKHFQKAKGRPTTAQNVTFEDTKRQAPSKFSERHNLGQKKIVFESTEASAYMLKKLRQQRQTKQSSDSSQNYIITQGKQSSTGLEFDISKKFIKQNQNRSSFSAFSNQSGTDSAVRLGSSSLNIEKYKNQQAKNLRESYKQNFIEQQNILEIDENENTNINQQIEEKADQKSRQKKRRDTQKSIKNKKGYHFQTTQESELDTFSQKNIQNQNNNNVSINKMTAADNLAQAEEAQSFLHNIELNSSSMAPFSDNSKNKNQKLKSSPKYISRKRKDGLRELFSQRQSTGESLKIENKIDCLSDQQTNQLNKQILQKQQKEKKIEFDSHVVQNEKIQSRKSFQIFQPKPINQDTSQNQIDKIQIVSERGMQSFYTKSINKQVNKSLACLDQFQNSMDPGFSNQTDTFKNTDIQQNLYQAKRKIKIIQYKCNTTVAKLNERITNIEVPSVNNGASRGPEQQIDIIENCEKLCKVNVQDRRAPLKFHLRYIGNQIGKDDLQGQKLLNKNAQSPKLKNLLQSSESPQKQKIIQYPDLQIMISEDLNNLNEKTCYQMVKDPGPKFLIKLKEEQSQIDLKEQRKKKSILSQLNDRKMKDCFKQKVFYLSINSSKDCSIMISCSFPNQEVIKNDDSITIDDRRQKYLDQKNLITKFREKAAKQIHDLQLNKDDQEKYFKEISQVKMALNNSHKYYEKNFLERNMINLENSDLVYFQKKMMVDKYQQRLEEAKLVREHNENENQKKLQFNMVKWNLYKLKVDQIDENYANFKKRQLKILWWNQIISLCFKIKKCNENYLDFRHNKILNYKKLMKKFKIVSFIKLFLIKKRKTLMERIRLNIRYSFEISVNTQYDLAIKKSKIYLQKFFNDKLIQLNIMNTFKKFHRTCVFIKEKLYFESKLMRKARLQILSLYFDREKFRLINYYKQKAKKNKKLKQVCDCIVKITEKQKNKILIENFYFQKIYLENMKSGILKQAQTEIKRGMTQIEQFKHRIFPQKDEQPLFTESEYKNNVDIHRQLLAIDAFLFKGQKDYKPIGLTDGHELYDPLIKVVKKKKLHQNSIQKQITQDKKSILVEEDDQGEDEAPENESEGEQMSAAADSEKEDNQKKEEADPSITIVQEDQNTKSGKSKVQAQQEETSKKSGSKKKKKKVVEIKLPQTFDLNEKVETNKYLPNRGVMQKLVLRASLIKPTDDGPQALEIRPWVVKLKKELNEDIFF